MPAFELTLDLDTSLLESVLNRLPASLACNREPMRAAMAAASRAVMRFEHSRFRSASGGDGTWPDIAMATKLSRLRRQAKGSGSKARITKALAAGQHLPILSDSGTLESGLFEAGGPGHFQSIDESGVSEGVSGGTHPRFKGSVGFLATIQHYGSGRVPARPVMAMPDQTCFTAIGGLLTGGAQAAVDALISGIGQSPQPGYGTP